jgi:hypothetical protein
VTRMGDKSTSGALALQQTIAGQVGERLAHHDPADAELPGEGDLTGEQVTGMQIAALDLPAQPGFNLEIIGDAAGFVEVKGFHGAWI